MSWINFPGFRGGPAAVVHGHVSFYFNINVAQKWIFQDLSVTQILREINFAEPRSDKIAVFVIFEALIFVRLVNISLQKVQKLLNIKIQSL